MRINDANIIFNIIDCVWEHKFVSRQFTKIRRNCGRVTVCRPSITNYFDRMTIGVYIGIIDKFNTAKFKEDINNKQFNIYY